MPLLVKNNGVYTLLAGMALLAFSWAGGALPALALQGVIQSRTPLCDQPREKCQPLFFLGAKEEIQILNRQGSDWYKVKHTLSQRTGWVSAQVIALVLPTTLKREKRQSLPDKRGFWGTSRLGVFSNTGIEGLEGASPRFYEKGLRFSPQDRVIAARFAGEQDPHFYWLEAVDKRFVLWQLSPLMTVPEFTALAHFDTEEAFVGSAVHQNLTLIAGDARGPWGDAVLIALDKDQWPVWIHRDLRELWGMLPFALQTELKADSFQLLSLSPEGHLLIEAYNQKQAKKVILHWRYDQAWSYQQMLQWPKSLDLKTVTRWFVTANSEALVLVVNQDRQARLYLFPAGLSEMALEQQLDAPLQDVIWFERELWLLDAKALTRWRPIYAPAS